MGTGKKGQAEIIIVLGIIIIAAVVLVFTTQRELIFPPSTEVAALRTSLENEIEQNLYSKALETIETVGKQGGYIDPPEELSVSYQGSQVPYWQYAGQSLVPDKDLIETNIANAIKSYANQMSISEYQGKTVVMGPATSVDVTISPDSVLVNVWQPITIEGYHLSQPLEFSVQTGLGSAYDLASQITSENIQGRYLDHFTVASIFMYGALDGTGNPKVPSFGVLTQCGQVLYKNWFSVKDEVETLLKGSLAKTYMAGQTPENVLENSNFPVHVFPVKSSTPVSFRLAEPFTSRSFQFNPNPVRVHSEVIPFSAICMSPPYLVHYWLMYPIVAEVKENGYNFRFALQVYVDDNKAGDWEQAGVYLDEWMEQIEMCELTRCRANITVLDKDGTIPNANVIFSNCILGKTDMNGNLIADVPCGISTLEVYSDEKHGIYKEFTSSDGLEEKLVYVSRNPLLKIQLYNVEFTNISGNLSVNAITPNNRNVTLNIKTPSDMYFLKTDKASLVTQEIPSDISTVGSYVMSDLEIIGGFMQTYIFLEADKTIYVYVPILEEGITDIDAIYDLTDAMEECGSLPMTETPIDTEEFTATCKGVSV